MNRPITDSSAGLLGCAAGLILTFLGCGQSTSSAADITKPADGSDIATAPAEAPALALACDATLDSCRVRVAACPPGDNDCREMALAKCDADLAVCMDNENAFSKLGNPPARILSFVGFVTGLELVDLNGDGFRDAIASSGNDRNVETVAVLLNGAGAGDGQPWEADRAVPSWLSEDSDYHSHTAAGDINSDGCSDVVVGVMQSRLGDLAGGGFKVYMGKLDGSTCKGLEARPSFVFPPSASRTGYRVLGLALGDIDGDGDLDLAVGSAGDPPGIFHFSRTNPGPIRIYRNDAGTFSSLPTWTSDPLVTADVQFADVDRDGLLDLVAASTTADAGGVRPEVRVYLSQPGASGPRLPAAPSWTSAELPSEGRPQVIRAIDTVHVGSSTFIAATFTGMRPPASFRHPVRIYRVSGTQSSREPIWSSRETFNGGPVRFADLDGDGLPDLLVGAVGSLSHADNGGRLLIYRSSTAALGELELVFRGEDELVAQEIVVSDLNRDALKRKTLTCTPQGGEDCPSRHPRVFSLPDINVERIVGVRVDGQPVALTQLGIASDLRWISFPSDQSGRRVEIEYDATNDPDWLVSDYRPASGIHYYSRH